MVDHEGRRINEQSRLDLQKSMKERNLLGQFATPLGLALDITQYARALRAGRPEAVRFLEPALGTGVFYSALRQVFPAGSVVDAAGVEIDPAFAAAARRLWGGTGLHVVEGDFTRLPPDRRFNLILTNPPYVRHHHLSREHKELLKATVKERSRGDVSGLAGLYCYFLLLADAWLEDDGLAVWLIPSEFMEVNYGKAVKDYLARRVKLLHIHRFQPADVQFCDALVTSAIVVFEKSSPPPDHAVRMSLGGSISEPETSELVPVEVLRSAKKWTAFPGAGKNDRLQGTTLGDFFSVKRGLATGANSFFILDRHEARCRGVPDEFLKPILPSSRHLRASVIETDDDGYPRLERSLAIIDCPLGEDELRERFPRFWEYLETGKRNGVGDGYLTSRRTPWYSQERRAAAPFLCTYMGRQGKNGTPFRFFWNKSRATAANVYLLLYPKGPLKLALQTSPELHPVVLSCLQSITAAHLIGEGRVYGGGLHKLEPNELACLPADAVASALGQIDTPRQLELF